MNAPGWESTADVIVVGSGVAGLTAALDAAAAGLDVVVVTKGAPADSNTSWAQGGIAVVRDEADPGDSVAAHVRDTLTAGAGLSDPAVVAAILRQGPAAIAGLRRRGAVFDTGPAGLARTREGGHGFDRVIHAGGDATGAEVQRALLAAPGLPVVLADQQAVDLICDENGCAVGVSLLGADGVGGVVRAAAVVLATGGSGHVYAATSNPAVATGDGLAMALRAGAALADLEFFQFHPTVLWTGPGVRGHRPLVTEAVRGAGAVLIDATGARIMAGVHPLADLAPRDVVSLAISRRMAERPGGVSDHVYLDATGIGDGVFQRRFPTVTAACAAAGIDPTRTPIPVTPAAHYQCGGVRTDLSGRTDVPGLYAVGEVAHTGLHGANRLASNSLLEGLVMGSRAVRSILRDPLRPGGSGREQVPLRPVGAGTRETRQAAMSAAAGIGRNAAGLSSARVIVDDSPVPVGSLTPAAVEDANLALVSAALLASALERTESRGCHVRTDFPATDPGWRTAVDVVLRDGVPVARRAGRQTPAIAGAAVPA